MRRLTALILAGCAVTALLAACVSISPYFDASKPHRARDGFRNNYNNWEPPPFWKWQWERWRAGLPPEPKQATPATRADTDYLRANATEPTLTWIGHATLLLQVGSYNILTDPHFSDRASPVSFAGPKRLAAPGIAIDDLPHIDLVLISHNHYDHLDEASVKRLAAQAGGPPMFIVPLGMEQWLRAAGIANVVELDWWDRVRMGSLDVHLVPVQHWSQRTLFDRNKSLWGGFYVQHRTLSFFHAGDTGYSKDFADIRQRLGAPDIAAIPIGAYEPRWFMGKQHVDPVEAVQIHKDLGAKYSIGVHWGTFQLADEAPEQPPQALAAARVQAGVPADRFFVTRLGETKRLAPMLQAVHDAASTTPSSTSADRGAAAPMDITPAGKAASTQSKGKASP